MRTTSIGVKTAKRPVSTLSGTLLLSHCLNSTNFIGLARAITSHHSVLPADSVPSAGIPSIRATLDGPLLTEIREVALQAERGIVVLEQRVADAVVVRVIGRLGRRLVVHLAARHRRLEVGRRRCERGVEGDGAAEQVEQSRAMTARAARMFLSPPDR